MDKNGMGKALYAVLLIVLIIATTGLSACSSGIPQESYDSLLGKIESLEAAGKEAAAKASSYANAVETLQAVSQEYDSYKQEQAVELESVKGEYESFKQDAEKSIKEASEYKSSVEPVVSSAMAQLQADSVALKEASEYRESMAAYEGLAQAEAEARRIEAEAAIASQSIAESQSIEASKEAASRAAAEESSRKAEEEKYAYDTGITYDQLARTPDQYEGKKVKFSGKVLQILEGDDEIHIRLAVNSDYDTVLYCAYDSDLLSSRILEDDMITIYGISLGLYTYTSSLNVPITIPAVWVEKIDQ